MHDRPERRPVRWGDLRTRVLSAALLAPAALACIAAGGWAWAALVGIGLLGMASEWVRLCGLREWAWPGAVLVPLILLAWAVAVAGREGVALILLVAGWLVVWAVSRRAVLAAGLPYLGVAGVTLLWLRQVPGVGLGDVLLLIVAVWASDIGAYMAGRKLGGPKLAPAISPAKTWSGAVGGLLAAASVGAILAAVWPGEAGGAGQAALVASGLAVVAQAGDLLESALKRRFGVKDSGWLIPGHGGLLDRLDGVLAAAPVAALLAWHLGPGVHLWQ